MIFIFFYNGNIIIDSFSFMVIEYVLENLIVNRDMECFLIVLYKFIDCNNRV